MWQAASKKETFKWGLKDEEAFELVKREIVKNDYRCHFTKGLPIFLITDASPVAVAAVLCQISTHTNGTKSLKVVEYASRMLTKTQKNYAQFQKELLGIVTAVKHLQQLLRTTPFTIFTDVQTADTIISKSVCGHKRILNRHDKWIMELSEYEYKIKHLPGKLNVVDALSRLATVTTMNENVDDFGDEGTLEDSSYWSTHRKQKEFQICHLCTASNVNHISFMACGEVKEVIEKDEEIKPVINYLINSEPLSVPWNRRHKFLCVDEQGLLRYGPLVVLPAALRQKAMMIAHRTWSPHFCCCKNTFTSQIWRLKLMKW